MTSHVLQCVRAHTEHQGLTEWQQQLQHCGADVRVSVSTCLSSGKKSLAAMISLLSCWMTRSQLMPVWLAYRARAQRRSLQAESTTRCKPMSSTSPNVCACSKTSMCHLNLLSVAPLILSDDCSAICCTQRRDMWSCRYGFDSLSTSLGSAFIPTWQVSKHEMGALFD